MRDDDGLSVIKIINNPIVVFIQQSIKTADDKKNKYLFFLRFLK